MTFATRKKPDKPKVPERKMITVSIEIQDGWSLDDLIKQIEKKYRDIGVFTTENDSEDYCPECNGDYSNWIYFKYDRLENDIEFEKRMKEYEKRIKEYEKGIKEYNDWYNINNIEKVRLNPHIQRVVALEKQLQRAKKRLEDEKAKKI